MDNTQFWQFSLALYPPNQQLLLQWQDHYQLNVNLALFLLFLHRHQQPLSEAGLVSLQQQLQLFGQQVTQPLRSVRRAVPTPWLDENLQRPFRQQLLHAELAAEQLEQQLLLQHYAQLPGATTGSANAELLTRYLELLQAPTGQLQQQIIDLYQQAEQLQQP
ncbi:MULTISPECIES: TIGR02444 family protein [Rheinheimera]|uniref:TIGR02444 family protein n=1 Tax=Rheinheimera marina TaxID=1774958 RepID=A0ABV9JGD2_9GAMM